MEKTYQPQVIELGKKMMQSLIDSEFFIENEITDHIPSFVILHDFLTEKFINGQICDGAVELDEEEFTKLLSSMRAACILASLKKKGFAESYEDENTEEVFFLTKKGKEYGEKLKEQE